MNSARFIWIIPFCFREVNGEDPARTAELEMFSDYSDVDLLGCHSKQRVCLRKGDEENTRA
jgi:hypothetical protein